MFNDYMRKCGLKACVISVSGGIDSAVIMALSAYAQKQEGSPIEKVINETKPN
jgi:NAD+ synthase (glutamine-hydrolysing)